MRDKYKIDMNGNKKKNSGNTNDDNVCMFANARERERERVCERKMQDTRKWNRRNVEALPSQTIPEQELE